MSKNSLLVCKYIRRSLVGRVDSSNTRHNDLNHAERVAVKRAPHGGVTIEKYLMPEPTLYGIVEFSTSLFCSSDALEQTVDISIGGHTGTLALPSLPDWGVQEEDPLHKPLLGPAQARTWKRGESLIYWGRPNSYPAGDALVDLALIEFPLHPDNLESGAQRVYEGFGAWLDLFEKYVILLTKQNTHKRVSGGDGPGRIELLIKEDAGLRHLYRTNPQRIAFELSGGDEALHLEQFREASRLSSQRLPPRFEYRLLLEAYSARKNEDYRKAIIEAATALEICLTARIMEEFDTQRVSFGEKLLQKFRMLGGRFELVRILGISLPKKHYESLVIQPRNGVVHRAAFPNKALANQVISEVEELLRLFFPQVHQDTPEV